MALAREPVQTSGAYICLGCGSYIQWWGSAPSEARPLCGLCDHTRKEPPNEQFEKRGFFRVACVKQ